MNNNGQVPEFEKFPGARVETVGEREVPPEQDFAKHFESGVPPFAGFGGEKAAEEKKFGQANPENMYYGEAQSDESEAGEEYDAGIADAAALINYGVGMASEAAGGLGELAWKLENFDASSSDDPIGDFYKYLGIDTPEEAKELEERNAASAAKEAEFRHGVNAPSNTKSVEGARNAIKAFQDFMREVKNSQEYAEVQKQASNAGMSCFDYVSKVALGGEKNLMGVLSYLGRHKGEASGNGVDANDEQLGGGVASTGVETENVDAEVESADSEEPSGPDNILRPEFGKEGDLEQRMRNGEQLNPEILQKAA